MRSRDVRAGRAAARGAPGERLPLVSVLPFVILLVSIALLPVFAGSWWEANANKGKVAALFALPLAGLMVFHFGLTGLEAIVERLFEYISLIALLGSLFVVCGGIVVEGTPKGTPRSTRSPRVRRGPCQPDRHDGRLDDLDPAADPGQSAPAARGPRADLFDFHRRQLRRLVDAAGRSASLSRLSGRRPVRLDAQALSGVGARERALLAIFFVWDWRAFRREKPVSPATKPEIGVRSPHDSQTPSSFAVRGLHNVVLLAGIVATVFAAGRGLGNGGRRWPFGVQEVSAAGHCPRSFWYTPATLRERNRFTFGPIIEVAVLFAGIFVTMTPALLILNARGARLGLHEPWQILLGVGPLVERFGQRADVSGLYRGRLGDAGGSPPGPVPGSWSRAQSRFGLRAHSGRHLVRLRLHGGAHLHWERAELHGPGHRPGVEYPHAELSRLHGVFGVDTPSALWTCDDSLLSRVK